VLPRRYIYIRITIHTIFSIKRITHIGQKLWYNSSLILKLLPMDKDDIEDFDLPELDGPVPTKIRISIMDSVCVSCEG
jgi:hypothetical protein